MTTTQRVDVERLSVSVERLPPIERDEQMQRDYIPIPGGWEVQTKGKGSTYRIAKTDDDDGERWPVTDRYLQDALTNMAHAIRADYAALLQQLAELDRDNETMRGADYHQSGVEQEQEIIDLEAKLAEREAEVADLADVLLQSGFVRCDIPACNCGSWHHRYGTRQRLDEIYDQLRDAGYINNSTGNLASNGLRNLIADKEAAERARQGAETLLAELAKAVHGIVPGGNPHWTPMPGRSASEDRTLLSVTRAAWGDVLIALANAPTSSHVANK